MIPSQIPIYMLSLFVIPFFHQHNQEIKEARRRAVASLLSGLATHAKAQGLAPAPGQGLGSSVLPLMRGEAVERAAGDRSDRDDDIDVDGDDIADHSLSSSLSSSSLSSPELSVLCRTPEQVDRR